MAKRSRRAPARQPKSGVALWRAVERAHALVRRHIDAGRIEAAKLVYNAAGEAWYRAKREAPQAVTAERWDAVRHEDMQLCTVLYPPAPRAPVDLLARLGVKRVDATDMAGEPMSAARVCHWIERATGDAYEAETLKRRLAADRAAHARPPWGELARAYQGSGKVLRRPSVARFLRALAEEAGQSAEHIERMMAEFGSTARALGLRRANPTVARVSGANPRT